MGRSRSLQPPLRSPFHSGFNWSTQHFNFLERWRVGYDLSLTDIFHGQTEVGDLGSMATWSVDELDWPHGEICFGGPNARAGAV